ncbi:MAG: hypothetical protein JNL61_09275 [Rhizobiaceae bacterium]|nr:hypothetical protein [Rhizobiaceae bacterium]
MADGIGLGEQLRRGGFFLPAPRHPTVVLAGKVDEIAVLYGGVDAALRRRPGYRLVLAVQPADIQQVRRRYTHEMVLAEPFRAARERWSRGLDVRAVVGRLPIADGVPSPAAVLERLPPVAEIPAPGRESLLFGLIRRWRIGTLAELRRRLGAPHTIVCLGNGPSSEDKRLAGFGGAALFRVNWNYLRRDPTAIPDAVFTADPDLPPRGRRPMLVFPTTAAGRPILERHAMRFRWPASGFVFLDDLDPPPADLSGPLIPTNGALMIAVAAALGPQRMVIAGIDLYRHAAGRYPGEANAVDGYARGHSLDVDLALIRSALAGFGGEVVNLSDNLRFALDGK